MTAPIARVALLAVFAVVPLTAGGALAAPASAPYAINGRPVPFACLDALLDGEPNQKPPVYFDACDDPAVKPIPSANWPGMIGRDDETYGGYFYYRVLGRLNGLDLIFTEYSGGGTGRFTSVLAVIHDGATLKVAKRFAGGDRCNGGLSGPRIVGGKLTYGQNATSFDLIKAGGQAEGLAAYKDLEAGAMNCVAVLNYSGDTLTGVTLTAPDQQDREGWTEDYPMQSCFNRAYRAQYAKGRPLSPSGLAAFARGFRKTCG
jgi:hypothetical protein